MACGEFYRFEESTNTGIWPMSMVFPDKTCESPSNEVISVACHWLGTSTLFDPSEFQTIQ